MGHGSSVGGMGFHSLRSSSRRSAVSRRTTVTRTTKESRVDDDSAHGGGPTYDKSDDTSSPSTVADTTPYFTTTYLPNQTKLVTPLIQISVDMQSHKMTGHGAFRGDAYKWLLLQLELKLSIAQDCIHSYIGHSQRHDLRGRPNLFVASDYVDLVCSRPLPAPLDQVGAVTWNALTNMPTHAIRMTRTLDSCSPDILYVQVRLDSGHTRNAPLVVNVLYKRIVTAKQAVFVYRSILEDDRFPVPRQPLHIGVSGWMVCKANEDGESCHEHTFVRARLSEMGVEDRSLWLADIVRKWFRAQESALRAQLSIERPTYG
ncbi:hypothetical protein H310_09279 [Aphanomyces invadans]|uniref:START domain-containing protein n=1 Tax=Aphanomyces invadans TaxID=157072 RepID=A0A024TVH9_9STRA|nr:hypothetical protein H310_09279 [Aphanomyces invadans]ETV97974.1 hypothetical protein H310_09279 [Aphanomyces invadans]|eukprot:XP_008873535.1 hypothetical protein H310_09279 [Aphanomyces invadans]